MNRALLAAAMLVALAGCNDLQPFETVPAAPAGPADPRARVGLCYDGMVSSPAEMQKAAQSSCPAHTVAERVDTDYWPQTCPLLLPARATYVCAAGH